MMSHPRVGGSIPPLATNPTWVYSGHRRQRRSREASREDCADAIHYQSAKFVGARNVRKPLQEFITLNERECRGGLRELDVLLASGAKLAENDIVGLHAPAGVSVDANWYGSLHPSMRRVGRGLGGHALGIVAMFEIEFACFAEHE